jgi:Na+/proline symporter
MNLISQAEGFVILAIFGISMIALVYFLGRKKSLTNDQFLVANRDVSWIRAALSIAVSWIWAPAIFIVSMQAYTKGIAGAFWFIAPNILCFFIFAPLAVRLRRFMPNGYTLPEFILKRFNNDSRTHISFLIVFFGYQLGAIIINALAGGTLLHILTGMDFTTAVLALSFIALAYSLISGLEASILTDVVQMLLVLFATFVIVPWVLIEAGGFSAVLAGLGGVSGEYSEIFNPWIAYSFGIAMTFGLIAGPIGDQMFFQRAFAVNQKDIIKTFVCGGLFFAFVPVTLR